MILVNEPWLTSVCLLGGFFLLVLLGMALMTVIRWQACLNDHKAEYREQLRSVRSQARSAKRQILAVESAMVPDLGRLLTPMGILGLFLKVRKSPRA